MTEQIVLVVVLFLVMALCGVAAKLLLLLIVSTINAERRVEKPISLSGWDVDKWRLIFSEYRRCCPQGHLDRWYKVVLVTGVVSLIGFVVLGFRLLKALLGG